MGIACMGVIEHAFAEISARIGTGVVERGGSRLPTQALCAACGAGSASRGRVLRTAGAEMETMTVKRERIERGLALGAHVFDRLYRELLVLGRG